MNVLLCAPYDGVPGGISKWANHIVNYYNSLQNPNIDLSVLSMGRSVFMNINSSAVFRIKYGIRDYSKIFKNYKQLLSHNHYDVIHLTSSASWSLVKDIYMLSKARARNIKTVVHFHFGRIPELFLRKNWEWSLLKRVLHLADQIIVIDRMSYETLISAGYMNVVNVPNPVAPEVMTYVESNIDQTQRFDNLILYVGHIVKTKGVYELVEACKAIPNIRLRMIGPLFPGIKDELLRLATKNDDISWIEICGERSYEQVLGEMMKCTVFVLPTYTEGFPNVILESMTCGCSIVATTVGAIPEMLAEDENNSAGLLIPPQNVQLLKTALVKMLKEPDYRIVCGRNARSRAIELYNMNSVWIQLVDVWKSLC